MLSPDGFVAGLFGTVSTGSFSPMGEPKSFAMLHAGFIDQLYLNRVGGKDVPLMTETEAIKVPGKDGVWEAPENLRDSEGKPVSSQPGKNLMLVRVEIRKAAIEGRRQVHAFAVPPGLRPQDRRRPAGRQGRGRVSRRLHRRRQPAANQTAGRGDLGRCGQGHGRQPDDRPGVPRPDGSDPVLIEFKRNNVAKVSAVASAEDAPQPIPFGSPAPQPQAAPESESQPQAEQSAEPAEQVNDSAAPSNRPRQRRGLSDISRSVTGDVDQEN